MTKNRHILQYLIMVPLSLSVCLLEELSDPSLIRGSPPVNAVVDIKYSFRPAGKVIGGNAINFSIINNPARISFDATIGHLRGTRDDANGGAYNNIEITGTDEEILTMETYNFAATVINSESVDSERFNGVVMLAA